MTKITTELINQLFNQLEKLVPIFKSIPEDEVISNGNVAVCVIDEEGNIYGKMFGEDKARNRNAFKIAWTKASQVWLTGVPTGEYERQVFNGLIPENANGIDNPDLIGWVGGQPIALSNGIKIAVGFSGFRGTTDIEIVLQACKKLGILSA